MADVMPPPRPVNCTLNRDVEAGIHVRAQTCRRYSVQARVGARSIGVFQKYANAEEAWAHGERLLLLIKEQGT